MERKTKLLIIIITFILTEVITIVLFFNCFNKLGNYSQRGEPYKGKLASDVASAYNLQVFQELNTIVTNEDYGEFILKRNGEFYYFPGEYNVLDYNEDNVYSYQGYWYKPLYEIRFTVTRTKTKSKKLNFKDLEYFCAFEYVNSENYAFDDNLFIRAAEFKVLDNELTRGNNKRLRLDDSVIIEFLEQK